MNNKLLPYTVFAILALLASPIYIVGQQKRILSGVLMTPRFELVPDTRIEIRTSTDKIVAVSDKEGSFRVEVPIGDLTVSVVGKNIETNNRSFLAGDSLRDVRLTVIYAVPPISETVTIDGSTLTPEVELRNRSSFENSLFARDDQLVTVLNAGINAGQHEGGGKSLEIRRYGFNTDHGGVNGGLKILVDNIQQNHGTQGHGQGYLGSLKSLTPELVDEVNVISGPFSPAYGDFSGLGVVHVRLRESLDELFTARLQGGSFGMRRAFLAVSPSNAKTSSLFAYEPSYTDGPFISPLRYRRDNVTGSLTRRMGSQQTIGFKFNAGENSFFSSGQIPLDLVDDGRLDRFGFLDPDNGGKVKSGTASVQYSREWSSGSVLKADAFIGRSLFDLWSNFTFFLLDPVYGDEIQQHDSRLQGGGNVQYLHPYKLGSRLSVLTIGGNVHLNGVNVGLYPSERRGPSRKFRPENIDNPDVLFTSARARVNNYAAYVNNGIDFLNGRLRIETGLRLDYFGYRVRGFELGGREAGSTKLCNSDFADPLNPLNECALFLENDDGAYRLQPKIGIAFSPSTAVPATVYFNYGRGISSQDARGVARNPDAPKISTTDFYQFGASYSARRFSLAGQSFFIDRSNEQVYIPDDGSIEFASRSRSYGLELRGSLRFNRFLSLNGGVTQVLRAFYPGQFTESQPRRRIFIDSAPRTVANGGLTISELKGFNAALNWRHISAYRLDGENDAIRAAGHDVVDFYVTKRLSRWLDATFAIDNLLDKRYFETQNFFESRSAPDAPVIERIHATPGYPFTFTAGLRFRVGRKN
ncbi:MAG: TonB-dependent receptor [Pyrinomonadaceae bacterium]